MAELPWCRPCPKARALHARFTSSYREPHMNITRRQWLVSTAALAANAAPRYRPQIAVAVYVWTQQFSREKKTLAQGIEEMFPALVRAGYKRVELMANFFAPELRDRTRALLKQHKLDLPIVYIGGPMHEPEGAAKTTQAALDLAELVQPLGARALAINPAAKRARKTDDELRVQAEALDQLGARLRQRKMGLYLHQHAPEMQEDAREWRYDLAHTDPKNLALCLDVDWIKRGGQDVMTLVKEAAPRLGSLHLRSMRGGVWTEEFGDGDIDYREVAAFLKKTGFTGVASVELAYEKGTAITRSLEEDLRRSREYAEKVLA